MKTRNVIVGVIIVLVIAGISYYYVASRPSVTIEVLSPKFIFIESSYLTPIYHAIDSGIFSKYSLTPQVTYVRGGAEILTAFSTGAADLAPCDTIQLGLGNSRGIKIRSVAMWSTLHGWGVLVKPDSPIKTSKDLQGKKVGITTKASTTDAIALATADKFGVNIQVVPVGAPGLVPALEAGTVDAISIFPPASLNLVIEGKARFLLDVGDDLPILSYPGVALCASEDFIKKHPEALKNILRAAFEGQKQLQQNRDLYVKLATERFKVSKETANLLYDKELKNMFGTQSLDHSKFEQGLVFRMKIQAPEAAIPPAGDLYTNDLVKAIGG